jgi:hypothetical protein
MPCTNVLCDVHMTLIMVLVWSIGSVVTLDERYAGTLPSSATVQVKLLGSISTSSSSLSIVAGSTASFTIDITPTPTSIVYVPISLVGTTGITFTSTGTSLPMILQITPGIQSITISISCGSSITTIGNVGSISIGIASSSDVSFNGVSPSSNNIIAINVVAGMLFILHIFLMI